MDYSNTEGLGEDDKSRSNVLTPLLLANGQPIGSRDDRSGSPETIPGFTGGNPSGGNDEMGFFVNGASPETESPSANSSPVGDLNTNVNTEDRESDSNNPKVEEDEPSDLSKSVTFAEDVAVYNLNSDPITTPLLHPEASQENWTPASSQASSSLMLPESETAPAVLDIDEEKTKQISSPVLNMAPTLIPLRYDLEDELEKPEASPQDDGEASDVQRHVFQVTVIDEPSPPAETADLGSNNLTENDGNNLGKLGKADSYISDSGHSSLSYNQDTIGPLENQSFLKNLNYSVSQAAVNEAGAGEDDLDIHDFTGVKADVDGGWAWVILFAACCSLMITGATTFAAGVLMPHILEQIEPDISMASWIGAVHTSVTCFSGPTVSSVSSRLGARGTAFVAGLALVGGLAGSYFATSFLHLILTHGVLAGLGSGFILNTMFVVTGQYFNRYRGFACGILATGAGFGIVAVGKIMTYLVENYGLNGAYLLWAGICSHIMVFAMLLRPSTEEVLRDVEKKMSRDQIKMNNVSNNNSIPSGMNSLASGLNSAFSNGDVYSAFSGRTNYSRRLRRYPSKRSSRGDLSNNPLLRNVLNKDMSNSNTSVATSRSHRSIRSAALSNGNLSLTQNVKLLDNTLRTAEGHSLAVPMPDSNNISFPSRSSNYTISPLALPDMSSDEQPSPSDKTASSSPSTLSPPAATPNNHIHSNFSLANETIPENEVVSRINTEAPPSPTFSRSAPSEFRKRLYSGTSQSHSHHTSFSQISQGTFMRGPMRNGDLDNESLTSTLVSNLRPKDILEPRYRLGSRSIPTLFGSVASFPTSLAIMKDDLSRIEGIGEPVEKTLQEHLTDLLDSLRLLRNIPFLLFIATCFLWALGDAPFSLYLPAFAISQGTSPSQASSLYTSLGLGSMFGRFLSGLVASDKMIGPLLIHIGCLGIAGTVSIFTPLFAFTPTGQIMCAGLFGVYTGSLVPLSSLITIELLGISELGSGFGFLCMIQGIGYLIGPPLGGIVMTLGSILAMMIAVVVGREVGGIDDEQGSLDDLERALRRVSNCLSSDGSDDEDSQHGSPEASSDLSRTRASHLTQAAMPYPQTQAGQDGEDKRAAHWVEDGQDSVGFELPNISKEEGKGISGSPSNMWFEDQELETIQEEGPDVNVSHDKLASQNT
ncbi:monocarboxylate transporter 12 [Plakobranchus ocellatus]|uniref:Monocarboxylate transporter 12 n=1 Tax=Plakobranchus ocellatus TaxID=259542 RepID=A0AAV3Z063_9GAST|nr:monocarboxylate transporter 12 [Plakobranchus ocellatus]